MSDLKFFKETGAPLCRHSYPFANKVNPILHRFIQENAIKEDAKVPGTMQTNFQCDKLASVKEFKLLIEYVRNLILNIPYNHPSFPCKLELINWWGMVYNKGQYQNNHNHPPAHWAFVYYVNTPKGSSPLEFSVINKKIFSKAGEVVIFPAWIYHRVRPNKCNDRSCIVGNFYWKVL